MQSSDECLGTLEVTGGTADDRNLLEHGGEGHRVEGEDGRVTAEVLEGLINFADVDRAHRAEVLGDHEVGIERPECTGVERVEVFPGRQTRAHRGVDLARSETRRQGRVRDDLSLARLEGKVTFESDADDVCAGTHGEEDLRR